MKVDWNKARERFESGDGEGDYLEVHYENRGDPYREGVTLAVEAPSSQRGVYVWLEDWEAIRLRDLLLRLYPVTER